MFGTLGRLARTRGFSAAVATPSVLTRAMCTAKANPVVFFDMSIGGKPAGRIEMTLRADVVPKPAEVSASRGYPAPPRANHARARDAVQPPRPRGA